MKYSLVFLTVVMAFLCALFSTSALARALWLEGDIIDSVHSKLYFGEYGENRRESSPGELDNIISPLVTVIDAEGGEKTVTAELSTNHLIIPSGKTILVQALKQPVYEKRGDKEGDYSGPIKPYFYARQGKGGSLPLDIQQNGNKLRLTFLDKPLAAAELVIIAPNGWEKRLRTDENGEATFSLPGLGLYVAVAKYLYDQSGEFDGKAYERESHTVTLSLYQ